MSEIKRVIGRQILDSRGNPTVEVDVHLASGAVGRASVPSGASTGSKEAVELRDERSSYQGKGVLRAVENVNTIIANFLLNMESSDQRSVDYGLIDLDDTPNKMKLGANAILGASLAVARASSMELDMPLYRYLGGSNAHILPIPLANILNGGVHADSTAELQEFMIVPSGFDTFSKALQASVEIFHALKDLLKKRGYSTAVGDEGGFAPSIRSNEEAVELILEAIGAANYSTDQVKLAIDGAASELHKRGEKKGYNFWKSSKKTLSSDEMIDFWVKLVDKYPAIVSLEDPLDESDWSGWKKLSQKLGHIQLVGDDVFVTNPDLLSKGIEEEVANSILIKLNQIGTLTETMDVVELAKSSGYSTVISHRSGETEDTFISDISVALGSGQIKTGSLSRTERVAKYNQLLRIEEELGTAGSFPTGLFQGISSSTEGMYNSF